MNALCNNDVIISMLSPNINFGSPSFTFKDLNATTKRDFSSMVRYE